MTPTTAEMAAARLRSALRRDAESYAQLIDRGKARQQIYLLFRAGIGVSTLEIGFWPRRWMNNQGCARATNRYGGI
jgi:hypothetical protein